MLTGTGAKRAKSAPRVLRRSRNTPYSEAHRPGGLIVWAEKVHAANAQPGPRRTRTEWQDGEHGTPGSPPPPKSHPWRWVDFRTSLSPRRSWGAPVGAKSKSQAPSRPASPPRQTTTGMTLLPPPNKSRVWTQIPASFRAGALEQPGRIEMSVLLHSVVSAALPQLGSFVMQREMKLPFGPSCFRTVFLSSATSTSALRTAYTTVDGSLGAAARPRPNDATPRGAQGCRVGP